MKSFAFPAVSLRPLLLCFALILAASSGVQASEVCDASALIARTFLVESDGAKLHVLLRGPGCNAPLLLWLHGGPGGAETPLFRLYDGDLEKDHLVAYLDQRGAGQSYDPKADLTRLTIAQHLRDLDRVVAHLASFLPKQKPMLLGHSWGAALGFLYAAKLPEKVAAVVAINPLISEQASQDGRLAFIEDEAKARNDKEILSELHRMGPTPETAKDILRLQSLVDRYGGVFRQKPSFLFATIRGVALGYVSPWNIPRYIEANERSLDAMHNELSQLDLRKSIRALNVPLVFMLGRYDRQISNRAASAFFDATQAPSKILIWYENSAHNIPFEEPEHFLEQLREAAAKVVVDHQ